ncbi:MAG: hypothetical protein U0736_19075 [Gemmataceae bacterium]
MDLTLSTYSVAALLADDDGQSPYYGLFVEPGEAGAADRLAVRLGGAVPREHRVRASGRASVSARCAGGGAAGVLGTMDTSGSTAPAARWNSTSTRV